MRGLTKLADLVEGCASSRMSRYPTFVPVRAGDCPAAEQHLLTIGRAGVLSNRAIGAEELDTLLRLLGPMSGELSVRAALRRGVLRAENSAYGRSYAQCLRAA